MANSIDENEKHVKELRKTNPDYAKTRLGDKFIWTKEQFEALIIGSKEETDNKKEDK